MDVSDWIAIGAAGVAGYFSWQANRKADRSDRTATKANGIAEDSLSEARSANRLADKSNSTAINANKIAEESLSEARTANTLAEKSNATADHALRESKVQTKLDQESTRRAAVVELRTVLDGIEQVKKDHRPNGDPEKTAVMLKQLSIRLLEIIQLLPPDTEVKKFVWTAYMLVDNARVNLKEHKKYGLTQLDETLAVAILFAPSSIEQNLTLAEGINLSVQTGLIAVASVVTEMRFYDASNPDSDEFTDALKRLEKYPLPVRFNLE